MDMTKNDREALEQELCRLHNVAAVDLDLMVYNRNSSNPNEPGWDPIPEEWLIVIKCQN